MDLKEQKLSKLGDKKNNHIIREKLSDKLAHGIISVQL